MKKMLLAFLLSSLVLPMAYAFNEGLYFGGAIGVYSLSATTDASNTNTNSIFHHRGGDYSGVFQLLTGYSFPVNERIALGVQFDGELNAGEAKLFDATTAGNTHRLSLKRPYAFSVAFIPQWRVNEFSNLNFKLGYNRGSFKYNVTTPSGNASETKWLNAFEAGLGADLAITEEIDLRLMGVYDIYQEQKHTSNVFTTHTTSSTLYGKFTIGLVWHSPLMS